LGWMEVSLDDPYLGGYLFGITVMTLKSYLPTIRGLGWSTVFDVPGVGASYRRSGSIQRKLPDVGNGDPVKWTRAQYIRVVKIPGTIRVVTFAEVYQLQRMDRSRWACRDVGGIDPPPFVLIVLFSLEKNLFPIVTPAGQPVIICAVRQYGDLSGIHIQKCDLVPGGLVLFAGHVLKYDLVRILRVEDRFYIINTAPFRMGGDLPKMIPVIVRDPDLIRCPSPVGGKTDRVTHPTSIGDIDIVRFTGGDDDRFLTAIGFYLDDLRGADIVSVQKTGEDERLPIR